MCHTLVEMLIITKTSTKTYQISHNILSCQKDDQKPSKEGALILVKHFFSNAIFH